MKRFLLFLALFALGLATLFWFQHQSKQQSATPEEEEAPRVPVETGPPLELPLGKDQTVRATSAGAFSDSQLDPKTLHQRLLFTAKDHHTRGEGAVEFEGVVATIFDPDTREKTGELRAPSATGQLRTTPTPGLDADKPLVMLEPELELFSGPPFAPVTLKVPRLEVRFDQRRFQGGESVLIEGRALHGEGKGLEVDGVAQSVRILREPRVTLDMQEGGSATLSSLGELSIENQPDQLSGGVEIVARDKAKLVLAGARPMELDAGSVRLTGHISDAPDTQWFQASQASADGNVRLRPAEGEFASDHAELDFENSQPARARLVGHPRIDLRLRDVPKSDLPVSLPLEKGELPVTASGAGPLELEFGASPSFTFTGPATLSLTSLGASLSTRGDITGTHAPGEGFSTLHARGAVEVKYAGARLETEELEVRAFVDENGERAARMEAKGATRTTGTLPDGRSFTLTTRDGIVYVQSGKYFRVPEGRGVELKVEGEGGFLARADLVRDFDGRDLSFVAEGNVFFESAKGRGTGERLESHGIEHVELAGLASKPARFEFEDGELEAVWIETLKDRLSAREAVHARAGVGDEEYQIDSRWLDLERGARLEGTDEPAGLTLDAGGAVQVRASGPERRLSLSSDLFRVQGEQAGDAAARSKISANALLASGGVRFDYAADFQLNGTAERFEIGRDRHGRLSPGADAPVRLEGTLPKEKLQFKMSSGQVEFSTGLLSAEHPDIKVEGVAIPLVPAGGATEEQARVRAIAGRMTCDPNSVLFSQGVYLARLAHGREGWSLDADKALLTNLTGRETEPEAAAEAAAAGAPESVSSTRGAVQNLFAWGGFVARFGSAMQSRGESLEVLRSTSLMTITGAPAQLITPAFAWRAENFELNLLTGFLRSGRGELRSTLASEQEPWTLRYTSLEPVETLDETIQVLREPVLTSGKREVRASWALFWVDKQEWSRVTGRAMGEPAEPATPVPAPTTEKKRVSAIFGELDAGELGGWLREFYLEGNIEYSIEGDRKARAEAVYLDLVDGHGWVSDFDMAVDFPVRQRPLRLKLRADWLRLSADGSFRASSAVATTCEFEKPHYVIKIGDLRMTPRMKERPRKPNEPGKGETVLEPNGWDVAAHDTSLVVARGMALPLPKIDFPVTPNYQIDRENFRLLGFNPAQFGNDSKFGTFFRANITMPLGWFAHAFDAVLSGDSPFNPTDREKSGLEGDTSYSASWLGSRGLLFGISSEMFKAGRYKFDVDLDGIFDRGEDKGLIRVPTDDRSEWRAWYHARGRFFLRPDEWVDAVFTRQTDPGVQSEFYESDFLRFEERETYLHWRRADGENYWRATAEARVEDFRTEVLEQPSLGFFRGRSRIGHVGKAPLIYSSDSSAGYYVRREGDPQYEAPFADGLGEREVLRVETKQRLETPVSLGALGLRAVPFVEAQGAAWNEGADPDEQPARGVLLGGATLATTFWKLFSNGSRHEWSPSVGVHGDLAVEEQGGALVPIDSLENSVEGKYVDLGLRSRWVHPERQSYLDLELRESHAQDLAAGAADGWMPLVVRGSWLSYIAGMPVGFTHEARYDIDNDQTPYSRSFFGWEPIPPLEFEAGYHSARDLAGDPLYNAFSAGARYTFSPKWEIEGRQTISTLGDGRLSSEGLIRRTGHDFVFEIETAFTAGEGGGNSIRFNVSPLLLWRRSHFGLLERWRGQNN